MPIYTYRCSTCHLEFKNINEGGCLCPYCGSLDVYRIKENMNNEKMETPINTSLSTHSQNDYKKEIDKLLENLNPIATEGLLLVGEQSEQARCLAHFLQTNNIFFEFIKYSDRITDGNNLKVICLSSFQSILQRHEMEFINKYNIYAVIFFNPDFDEFEDAITDIKTKLGNISFYIMQPSITIDKDGNVLHQTTNIIDSAQYEYLKLNLIKLLNDLTIDKFMSAFTNICGWKENIKKEIQLLIEKYRGEFKSIVNNTTIDLSSIENKINITLDKINELKITIDKLICEEKEFKKRHENIYRECDKKGDDFSRFYREIAQRISASFNATNRTINDVDDNLKKISIEIKRKLVLNGIITIFFLCSLVFFFIVFALFKDRIMTNNLIDIFLYGEFVYSTLFGLVQLFLFLLLLKILNIITALKSDILSRSLIYQRKFSSIDLDKEREKFDKSFSILSNCTKSSLLNISSSIGTFLNRIDLMKMRRDEEKIQKEFAEIIEEILQFKNKLAIAQNSINNIGDL